MASGRVLTVTTGDPPGIDLSEPMTTSTLPQPSRLLLLAVLALALVGALTCWSLGDDDAVDADVAAAADVAADVRPAKAVGMPRPTDSPRSAVLASDSMRVVVRDQLTQRPLAGVSLQCGDATAVTDAAGQASLARTSCAGEAMRLEVGAELGSKVFHRSLPRSSTATIEFRLPVWSAIRVGLSTGLLDVRGRVVCRPERDLSALDLPAHAIQRLGLVRHQPAMLERALDELGVARALGRVAVAFHLDEDGGDEVVVHTLADGVVDLAVFGTSDCRDRDSDRACRLRPMQVELRLRPGGVVGHDFELRRKPVVAGRLVDENQHPIANARVVAAASSDFVASSFVPHDAAEPSNAAVVLARPRGAARMTALAHRAARTDADGRFVIPVGFTDRVAVWALPPGHRLAYLEYAIGERDADVTELTLVASRAIEPRRLRIETASGAPVPAGSLVQLHCLDRRYEFQCHAPDQRVGEDGFVSLDGCIPGANYRLAFANRNYQPVLLAAHARRVSVTPTSSDRSSRR